MRSHVLLKAALLAGCSHANPYNYLHIREDLPLTNSSIAPTSATTASSQSDSSTLEAQGYPDSSSNRSFSRPLSTSAVTSASSFSTSKSIESPSSDYSTLIAVNSSSTVASNSSTPRPTACTGCVLEALFPTTITFPETQSEYWTTKTTTIGTIITEIITYEGDGFVTTEYRTVNATKLVTIPANQTNVHTTQFFTWQPRDDVTLTFEAGPTYVAYTELWGGLDWQPTPIETYDPTATGVLATSHLTCAGQVESVSIVPTAAKEYSGFIQTYTKGSEAPDKEAISVLLPPAVLSFVKDLYPEIQDVFSGSDIATCTLRPTDETTLTVPGPATSVTSGVPLATSATYGYYTMPPPKETPPEESQPPATEPAETPPPKTDGKTTYLSSTYASSSTHITRPGYLRTPSPEPAPPVSKGPGVNSIPDPPQSKPEERPKPPQTPNNPPQTPENPPQTEGLNPDYTSPPKPYQTNPGQSITVGNTVVPIHPIIQNPDDEQNPGNQQNSQNPGVVIGTQTLAPGEATTINGVFISVPPNGGGSSIVVDGTTVGVNPVGPTGPAVLTVGDNTVTANPEGQFVVGDQTLNPGGPAITVDGSIFSLGPSGTIAVVNGVTQTLGNAPVITGPPALTVNGQTIPATVIGGTTQFVLGPGQTLTPGGVVVVGGTTFSLPNDGSGSTIIVNGVTQTLDNAPGLPILTIDGQTNFATIVDGTTAFVLGPGQTLTPGGSVIVDGTTISMPPDASGTVVVIDGTTSTLGEVGPITGAPKLTIDGETYSATVRDGTTEYVLGEGTTLKPGEAVTIDGTTISLDPKGTALIINGKTSSIPKTPASNNASTTKSASGSKSSNGSKSSKRSSSGSSSRSSTSVRNPGNFIASGIGITSKEGNAVPVGGGLDKWVEGMVIGFAGWLLMLL